MDHSDLRSKQVRQVVDLAQVSATCPTSLRKGGRDRRTVAGGTEFDPELLRLEAPGQLRPPPSPNPPHVPRHSCLMSPLT